jgi:DNA-directed RNA polymerase subunit RPC12/RpoP
MPIRFRCVYCSQLLGIARRKAGSVVRCTHCNGEIVVPEPAAALPTKREKSRKSEPELVGSGIFERNDFDDLLKPIQDDAERAASSLPTGHDFELPGDEGLPATAKAGADVWLRWAILLSVGTALFAAGFFLGRLTGG